MQPYRSGEGPRTNTEKGNVAAVLDGDLDDFIEAYLLVSMTPGLRRNQGRPVSCNVDVLLWTIGSIVG